MNLSKYPHEVQIEAYLEAIRHEYRQSLYKTAKDLVGYQDMTERTHMEMVDALEDEETKRKLIVMPRGTFKSSVAAVAFPIWLLINNVNLRILIDSEVYSNSKNFLREIKAHMQGERMVRLFGHFVGEVWNEGEITIAQRTKPLKEASITCGGVGTVKVGQHYDVIIGDDLNSMQNSATVEGRRKVIQHVQMYTGLLEPQGTVALIGTRYAVDDIIGWALDNEVNREGLVG